MLLFLDDSSNGNQPFENALHSKLNNSYTQNFLKTNFESQTPYNKKSSFSIPCSKRTSNSKTDCCYEEELYVKGKTAIWSRGNFHNI